MEESDWLSCGDPKKLFRFKVEGKRSSRKLRLFAVACCRRGWELMLDPRTRQAVEAHETYADRLIDKKALEVADAGSFAVLQEGVHRGSPNAAIVASAVSMLAGGRRTEQVFSSMHTALSSFSRPGFGEGQQFRFFDNARKVEAMAQANLYREIFGNPFRSTTIDPAWVVWNNGIIPDLALAIYDEKAFDRMPILADALEEAGCGDAAILDHCRGPSEHVRGCWIIDTLLGHK